jgi:hypothetical protein
MSRPSAEQIWPQFTGSMQSGHTLSWVGWIELAPIYWEQHGQTLSWLALSPIYREQTLINGQIRLHSTVSRKPRS